ncbi:MAG: alpha/beta-type small acid-soluble spore protein [Blautia sp.]|nr:alpha/beta-type small acid-soluble spore protein [Blautia sp.]MDY5031459.1 small, acid-soluble spore protein, alpha/beta type [Blautia sp.]
MNKDKEVQAYLDGTLTSDQKVKYEIAQELGVLDQVLENGWKSLSAKETGRIGGLMTRRKKQIPPDPIAEKNENCMKKEI